MTGIGPVEPHDPGPGDAPDPTETIGTDTPRLSEHWAALSDRWTALPVRRRRAVLLLAGCAAAIGALLALRPLLAATTPSPRPAQATTLRYDGPGLENGAFRFTVGVSAGGPVTLRRLDAWLPELGAATTPRTPLTVRAGEPVTITVWLAVYACTGLPHGIELPQIDVVLRNERAQQRHSFVFGDPLARDLWEFLRANCGPALPPEGPAPPAEEP